MSTNQTNNPEFQRLFQSLVPANITEGAKAVGANRIALERAILKQALETGLAPHVFAARLSS